MAKTRLWSEKLGFVIRTWKGDQNKEYEREFISTKGDLNTESEPESLPTLVCWSFVAYYYSTWPVSVPLVVRMAECIQFLLLRMIYPRHSLDYSGLTSTSFNESSAYQTTGSCHNTITLQRSNPFVRPTFRHLCPFCHSHTFSNGDALRKLRLWLGETLGILFCANDRQGQSVQQMRSKRFDD